MFVSKKWLNEESGRVGLNAADLASITTHDVFERCSPNFSFPLHMSPLLEALDHCEASVREVRLKAARFIIAAPPQHGKSETSLHWLAGFIARHPHLRNAIAANSIRLARKMSRKIRRLVKELGVPLREGAQSVDQWETLAGGGLIATGIGGHLTGEPIDGVLLIDDPFKSMEQAESEAWRETVWSWWESVADSRLHPGAAVLVVATRWSEDDLSGRLIDREPGEWTEIKMPAIKADGTPLWAEKRPIEWLEAKRRKRTERVWWALWMCEPQPPGGRMFPPLTMCTLAQLPSVGAQSIGVDLAYSELSTADESAVVVLRRGSDGRAYVVDVDHFRLRPTETVKRVRATLDRHEGVATWYASAMEAKQIEAYHALGIGRVRAIKTNSPKTVRAIETVAAAERGRLVVPSDAPWSEKLTQQVLHFTGQDGRHDDLVDALVAAYDALPEEASQRVATVPRKPRKAWGAM